MKFNSPFEEKVYFVVSQIPIGEVTTYGTIAQLCGLKSSARLVGTLMGKWAKVYPLAFHRVLNRNGFLTGKHAFGDNNEMQRLLEAEGIEVIDNQVDMKKYLWNTENIII